MATTRQDFEIAARVLWEGRNTSDSWERTAQAFHGIRLVARGRIKEDAAFLYDLAWTHAGMATDEEHARRMRLLEAA